MNPLVKILRWSISGLRPSMMAFAVAFAVPECLYLGYDLYEKGSLTGENLVVLILAALFLGGIAGALGWWTIFKPLQDKWSR